MLTRPGAPRPAAARRLLAQWKRQTVRVQFRAMTDGWLAASFRVDDVSLH